jgi:hypothetical protein
MPARSSPSSSYSAATSRRERAGGDASPYSASSYSPAPSCSSRGGGSEASYYSSLPTPSGYNTPREAVTPLLAAAGAVRSALVAADSAFAWLVEPQHEHRVALKPVPLPPRPEPLQHATLFSQADGGEGTLVVPKPRAGRGTLIEWREIRELNAALSDNTAALHRLSLELASRDVEV